MWNVWDKKEKMFGVLVGEPEGKRLLSVLRYRLENNIKMGLKEEDVGWIHLTQDRNHQWAVKQSSNDF